MSDFYDCRIQLIRTGSSVWIDLDKDVPVSLNISVTEVQDISKKNNSYTKPIAIPNTSENNKKLGQIWNINSANNSFDITVRNRCLVWSGGVIVMRGYIQLTGVKKTAETNSQGEQLMWYQALVTDDTSEFIDRIADGYLHDMDLSRYDHVLTPEKILDSRFCTWQSGYTYPQLYRTGGPYEPQDFKPAIFAKTYVNQMFEDAGYTWEGSAFNSPLYESLVVAYNGSAPSADNRTFKYIVGFSAASSTYGWTQVNGSNQQGLGTLTPVRFDDDTSTGFSNPFGYYNKTTGLATSQYNGSETLRGDWTIDIGLRANQDSYLFGQGYNGSSVGSELAASFLEFTVNVYAGQTNTPAGGSITAANLVATASTSFNYYSSIVGFRAAQAAGPIYNVPAGDNLIASVIITGISYSWITQQMQSNGIWVEVSYTRGAPGFQSGWWTSNAAGGVPVGTIPRILIRQGFQSAQPDASFRNDATTALVQGSNMPISTYIPRNIKKKDFFSSICQMMNLCVERDPDNETNLLIESRDAYYSGGTTVDWSHKLDISKEIEIKFLGELQGKKTMDFTWTDDVDDTKLKGYKNSNNLTYGELLIDVENQFLEGNRTIKPIFSMTPTVENFYGQPVPFIDVAEPKSTLRILSKGSAVPIKWNFTFLTGGTSQTTTINEYNWCGEYDSPTTPQWNLSWTMNQDVYYDDLQYIPHGLYENYYFNTVQNILNSRMLAGMFYLQPKDVARLRLNTKVWLDHTKCYFTINKITDFNPVQRGLTKVELLRYDG